MSDEEMQDAEVQFTEEQLAEFEENMLKMHGDLLHQLLQFDRFKIFMESNYHIEFTKDEEAKTARYVVMERTPQEAAEAMLELAQIMQKENPGIVVADASVMSQLEDLKKQ